MAANPVKGSSVSAGPPKKGDRTLKISKKSNRQAATAKPPAPGERKAMRKRVVLSNTNALEVQGMQDLSLKNMASEESRRRVLKLPGPLVDSLRALEAFKPNQGWSLFRNPSVLWREESIRLAQVISNLDKFQGGEARRILLSGEKGSGKTVMALQVMAMALLKGWVVINIPDAKDLVNAHTAYAPLPGSTPRQWVQKTYTANLLSQIARANAEVLSKMSLSMRHDLPIPVQSNMSLDRFAELGAQDPDIAWPIFQALWNELTGPGRPPVLYALDNLNHVMRQSEYLDPELNFIHAHDLALVRHFIQHLSGAQDLPNGGIVIAATSESNKPSSPALQLVERQAEARMRGVIEDAVPKLDPYTTIDRRSLESLATIEVTRLKGLSRGEAKAMMEYYAASGMLRQVVNQRLVTEKWTLAGGGIIGELERGTLRMRP
ncbi:MAG: 37S ribosomal protein S23 mitochondrial [Bogoriella megaspora]|nr:MAG: 37S ribosomal protein S23 mitochondrial [Bogoriella megaspora]